jgi:dipeptidyl aminopeptidase/acylaminoacyl peptidase
VKLNPQSGELTLLDRQHDEAWIGGPGMRAYGGGSVHWMPDSKHIWFKSEITGYAHLYTLNIETLEKDAITSGAYEIYDPTLSLDGNYWYYHTNEEHTGERHFYKQRVGTNKREKLTTQVGQHEVVVSPNDKWLAIRYSNATQPWELYVQPNKSNAVAEQVTHSTTTAYESYSWLTPDYVTFTASDGKEVPARLCKPKRPNGAAVMFVHGAGYLQNAHKGWSKYFREYMFHNFLVQQGYTVLDVDYRGSAGYGRDWRTAIYRHMGGRDLQDYVDGAKWLVDQHQIDKERIGIYGGSYGGFITLMALFTESETFAAGAALRSVTDWAHYNHSYTSNILNTPVLDSVAYHRSSPINFAEGLADPLLMCHGMIDMNVHFQDIVRLSQRLIDLGKEDWELAVYPLERHGFTEPESWTDEYKRIWKLFSTHLGTSRKADLTEN